MESLSPSTINVRLSAVRKLVGEARRAGMIESEEADRYGSNAFDSICHEHPSSTASEGGPNKCFGDTASIVSLVKGKLIVFAL
jgi:hypothetical protein